MIKVGEIGRYHVFVCWVQGDVEFLLSAAPYGDAFDDDNDITSFTVAHEIAIPNRPIFDIVRSTFYLPESLKKAFAQALLELKQLAEHLSLKVTDEAKGYWQSVLQKIDEIKEL